MKDGTLRPLYKPNGKIQYMHIKSNLPTNIIKHIPNSKENRLSNLSSNDTLFQESTTHYDDHLRLSGYIKKLKKIHKC